jgi:hypothetical protein
MADGPLLWLLLFGVGGCRDARNWANLALTSVKAACRSLFVKVRGEHLAVLVVVGVVADGLLCCCCCDCGRRWAVAMARVGVADDVTKIVRSEATIVGGVGWMW